jgi:hypothetical protein
MFYSDCLWRHNSQNKCSKYLPLESMHTWTHLTSDCGTISKGSGRSECFDRHKNCNGEVSLDFQLVLHTLEFLRVPTDSLLRTEINMLLGWTSKSVCWHTLVWFFWGRKLTPEVCPRILDTLCIQLLPRWFKVCSRVQILLDAYVSLVVLSFIDRVLVKFESHTKINVEYLKGKISELILNRNRPNSIIHLEWGRELFINIPNKCRSCCKIVLVTA